MGTREILNKEFSTQDFAKEQPYAEMLNRYKNIACNYARMENAIAVLSDLRTNTSYLYYGGFAQMLEPGKCGTEGKVSSIWEEEIFSLIHPDDLADKHLQELCFFHFVKQQPKKRRAHYYLTSKEKAEMLSTSIHTVSRHLQEILRKLQMKNSIEVCRVAKDLVFRGCIEMKIRTPIT